MSKSKRRQPPHRARAAKRPQRAARPRAAEDGLMKGVAAALSDGEPVTLLALVSAVLAALDVRPNPFDRQPQPELPSKDQLVTALLGTNSVETSAMLTVMAALSDDEVLRRRVSDEITRRTHALPEWLAGLPNARPVDRTVEVSHVLRDGENVIVGVSLPSGHGLTAVVYIDHNMGTLVKDAFIVDEPLPAMVERMLAVVDDPDTTATDLDPADARARIEAAIALSAMTWPPFETDTWPACRPLVEWIVHLLPGGGTGYQRPEWSTADRDALAERFFGSSFGTGLDDPDHRDLLDSLLWFGTDYGPGDPLRWSPAAVEVVLVDWIPRKIIAAAEDLAKFPDLLRSFIRFCHHERNLRPALTEQTLAAVDHHEPHYQQAIRSPRPQGAEALLAAVGALDPDDLT